MKKYIFLLVFLTLNSCVKDDMKEEMLVNFNFDLKLVNKFKLKLDDQSTKKNNSSEFDHVFEDEITIRFSSVTPGFTKELIFNPNESSSTSIPLPYGEYNWEIINTEIFPELSSFLPIYGSSSTPISIKEQNLSLDLIVDTDYALVTVNDLYVTEAFLLKGENKLNLNSKEGYYFGYVKENIEGVELGVYDVDENYIEETLNDVQKCIHYKYTLEISTVGINSLLCVCEPFEVVETYLIPNCGTNVMNNGLLTWYPFNGNTNDESGNGNNLNINTGAQLTTDRFNNNNSSFEFDGVNDYLKIDKENISEGFNDLQDISISSWSYMSGNNSDSATTYQTIIARRDFIGNPGGERHHFEVSVGEDGSIIFSSYNNQDTEKWKIQSIERNEGLYQMNQWNHIVYTFNSSTKILSLYLNSKLIIEEQFENMELFNYSHWINLGAITRTQGNREFNFWKGKIDDVGIWDRVISECEIEWLYNN